MSRWKLLDAWDGDLPHLSDVQLRERLQMALEYESRSSRSGLGKSAKARREWRQRREAVQKEMESRGLSP